MYTLEQVRLMLADRKSGVVAKEAKVSVFTIRRLMRGGSCNATTLEKLCKYLDREVK